MRSRDADDVVRVLLVAPSLRQLHGGQEVQGDLLHRLWGDDRDIRMYLVDATPTLPPGIRWVEHVRVLRTAVRLPFRLVSLWRSLRDVDVLHVFSGSHSSFLIGTLPACLLARARRTPSLVHYHNALGESHLATSRIARRILQTSDGVVVPSTYLQAPFEAQGVAATVIPNVVDESRFSGEPERTAWPIVVSLRNFVDYYAVDDVIRAFALVKNTHPSARLLLLGRGPEEGTLRALVRTLGISDVEFVGPAGRDEVARLLRQGAVLLNASRIDNMPVSLLEAFVAGVPVVTTSAGGIPTFARHGETAMLAAVGDVNALATHVRTVLDDRRLARRLVLAAKREVAHCRWDAVRLRWLSLYRRLAARSNSPL